MSAKKKSPLNAVELLAMVMTMRDHDPDPKNRKIAVRMLASARHGLPEICRADVMAVAEDLSKAQSAARKARQS